MPLANRTPMSDSANMSPSRIEINVDIRFHTEDVDILFCGRDRGKKGAYIPRYPVVARALQGIYAQMHVDNPFAETMLIEFETRLDDVFGLADTRIERCQALAAHAQDQYGITVRPFTRQRPFVHTSVVTVNSVALMDSKPAEQAIRELLRRQRSVNDLMIGYAKRLQPVTRQEVRDRSPRAQAAVQALRKCVVPEVLNKQTRCRFYRVRLMGQPQDAPSEGLDEAIYGESDPAPTHPRPQQATENKTPRTCELPLSRER